MNASEKFYRFAAECEFMAKLTHNPNNKTIWTHMAERWIRCAELFDRQSSTAEPDGYDAGLGLHRLGVSNLAVMRYLKFDLVSIRPRASPIYTGVRSLARHKGLRFVVVVRSQEGAETQKTCSLFTLLSGPFSG
jgi:hypothetical protein